MLCYFKSYFWKSKVITFKMRETEKYQKLKYERWQIFSYEREKKFTTSDNI